MYNINANRNSTRLDEEGRFTLLNSPEFLGGDSDGEPEV